MKGLWQSWSSDSDKSRRKVIVEWKNFAANKPLKDISHAQVHLQTSADTEVTVKEIHHR